MPVTTDQFANDPTLAAWAAKYGEPLFVVGQTVETMTDTITCNEDDAEIVVPAGTICEVTCVRECGSPTGDQGAWLYDVEGQRDGRGFWSIYDAMDAHQLRVVEG